MAYQLSAEAQAKIEALLAIRAVEFSHSARIGLVELREKVRSIRRLSGQDRQEAFATLYRPAHDLKGMGGTFGFSDISVEGERLCQLIGGVEVPSDIDLAIAELSIVRMQAVLMEKPALAA